MRSDRRVFTAATAGVVAGMRTRRAASTLALVGLVLVTACVSREPLTLEEYASIVSEVASEYDQCSEGVRQEVSDEFDAESGLSPEEDFAYFSELVSGWQTCFQEGSETLEGVEPPVLLTEAHEELISTRGDYLTEWRSFTGRLDSYDEIEAMFGAVEGSTSASALQAANAASCRVGEILDAEGVQHAAPCPGDGAEPTGPP